MFPSEFRLLSSFKQYLLLNYNTFRELYGLFVSYYLPGLNLLNLYFPGFKFVNALQLYIFVYYTSKVLQN